MLRLLTFIFPFFYVSRKYSSKQGARVRKKSNSFWRINNIWLYFWLFISIAIGFFLFRYIRAQIQITKSQKLEIEKENNFVENLNPVIARNKADKITTRTDIQSAAKNLAHHLGTIYYDTNHWYDILNPRGWTENDAEVAKILIYQRKNFTLLEKLYYSVYTNNRNLRNDILKLLDTKELKEVKKYVRL